MGRTIVSLGSSAALSFTLPPHRHRLLLLSKPRPLPRYFNLPLPSPAFLNPKLSCAPTVLRAPQCALHSHIDRSAFLQDAGATALVTAGAYMLVLAFDLLTKRNLVEQKLSRKLVHVLSGLLFMASWPLFSTSTEARYFAAVVPLLNCLRLLVYGLSIATDEGLVKSVTRDGKPEELLRGPLYYVLVLMLCALVFWRESPIGVIPLGIMSGGDGFADIMGRRFGALKLPYNQQKSWIGSICMCLFGFAVSIGMLYYFASLGYLRLDWVSTVEKVALISFVATLVESLPITEVVDDNISVPLTSMLMAFLFFGYGPPH
ncbi:probable phytol kinase, chloroplastic isoform X1 [Magnolia sinica]|uniref:probable phytol kinase, chloroplastic isoform X1 n=1 Tax=Magnolia sinica TaxID=86752 RepID=UPI00265B6E69|nr:probable phytol kinase, chloroplastic isoform X1 [Magnolia sinica]